MTSTGSALLRGLCHLAMLTACGTAESPAPPPTYGSWREISGTGLTDELGANGQSVIWTGREMIIWGGVNAHVACQAYTDGCAGGSRYDPVASTWTTMSDGPEHRRDHAAVWTGSEMIVWGGSGCGERMLDATNHDIYTPCTDGWAYEPETDTWRQIADDGAPSARMTTAVWTGREMIVWGGTVLPAMLGAGGPTSSSLGDGAAYEPETDTWRPLSSEGAPSARAVSSVWTEERVLFWGGGDGLNQFGDGASYDPTADSWHAIAVDQTLNPRSAPKIWTGTEMIIWGGTAGEGFAYHLASDTWRKLSGKLAPSPRSGHTLVWTGGLVIVWGGYCLDEPGPHGPGAECSDGARYDPALDEWTVVASSEHAPRQTGHRAVWTGSEMITFGGCAGDPVLCAYWSGIYTP